MNLFLRNLIVRDTSKTLKENLLYRLLDVIIYFIKAIRRVISSIFHHAIKEGVILALMFFAGYFVWTHYHLESVALKFARNVIADDSVKGVTKQRAKVCDDKAYDGIWRQCRDGVVNKYYYLYKRGDNKLLVDGYCEGIASQLACHYIDGDTTETTHSIMSAEDMIEAKKQLRNELERAK